MTNRAQIIGSHLSPYVRKVLVVLELKGFPTKSIQSSLFMGTIVFQK
jgi:glutathione S-transferase